MNVFYDMMCTLCSGIKYSYYLSVSLLRYLSVIIVLVCIASLFSLSMQLMLLYVSDRAASFKQKAAFNAPGCNISEMGLSLLTCDFFSVCG